MRLIRSIEFWVGIAILTFFVLCIGGSLGFFGGEKPSAKVKEGYETVIVDQLFADFQKAYNFPRSGKVIVKDTLGARIRCGFGVNGMEFQIFKNVSPAYAEYETPREKIFAFNELGGFLNVLADYNMKSFRVNGGMASLPDSVYHRIYDFEHLENQEDEFEQAVNSIIENKNQN